MLEPQNCFICLKEINNNNYKFDEFILNNMPCNCYRRNLIHKNCFDNSFKINKNIINQCLLCRTSIDNCIQHPDYELLAINHNWEVIKYVRKQTPEICLAALKQNSYALEYIIEQTHEICLATVISCGGALQYVKEQTYDICLAAVKQNKLALEFVKEQYHKICVNII